MKPTHAKTPQNCASCQPFGSRAARLILAMALMLAMVLAPAVLFPTAARADDSVAYVKDSSGEETYYTDWGSAKSAAYGEGNTLVMLADWGPTGTVYVADSKTLTIDMNGHRITGDGSGSVIRLYEHSSLTLMSSKPSTKFTYMGFVDLEGKRVPLELVSGGLVTGGYEFYGGGIRLDAGSHLTLDGVAVAGNHNADNEYRGGLGGGIYVENKGTIDMKNNASIQHNAAYLRGGGIYINGDDPTTINMDGAKICENYAVQSGGGIYINKTKNVHINLENYAAVDKNVALNSAGGICFHCSYFYLESSDKTGSVSNNQTFEPGYSGGGISTSRIAESSNEGLIKGINIKNNYSARDGGGIWLGQEWTKVVDCVITGNTAGEDGGGVYVNNDNNSLEGCTITGNYCDLDGKNYEGGGVFVSYTNDVVVSGLNVVTGNARGKSSGNADDVFLSQNVGNTIRAYVTGNLSKGSKVGVRTGATGDRRVASGFKSESNDCLFIDLDGYYVSYGTDAGGDAWQRHATKEFEAKVNGGSLGRYGYGATVTANGTSKDASKVFKCWSATESTGLYPFSSYVSDENLANPVVSFSMPQNDVDIVAEYVTRATSVTLAVDAPVPGQAFAATGTLSWEGSDGEERSVEVPVLWFELSGGTYSPVSETAGYATGYAVMAAVSQDLDVDLAFALDLSGDDVTVSFTGDGLATSVTAREASVDAEGSLSLISNTFRSANRKAKTVAGASVTVGEGTSADELRALLPAVASATTEDGQVVSLNTNVAGASLTALLDEDGNVKMPEGGKATVYVPLKASSTVDVPSSIALAVEVNVTERQQAEVEVPTVNEDGDEGSYDQEVSVTPTCATEGAAVMYNLEHSDDGATWVQDAQSEEVADAAISLVASAGGTRTYLLELWATKGDSESAHRTLAYVIDDVRPAETVTVTVKYADTAAEGQHGSKDSETVKVVKSSDASLMAPYRPGYVFEKWLASDGAELGTDEPLTLEDVTENTTVTAVYNPAVSGFDVYMDVSQADVALVGSATKVLAKVGESDEYVDATSYFAGSDGKVAITWSPSAEKAAHDTCYTASLTLGKPASGDVKYALASSLTVLINGQDVHGGAYVSKQDGETSLCVDCPNTGPAEYKSTASLDDVELSFDEAVAAKKAQDAGEGLSAWGLPSTVKVTYACGETEDYEIAWSSIDELDESATGEQELIATGTISFADRSYVSHVGDTETVAVKLKVAAPKADPDPEPEPQPDPDPEPSPSPDPTPDADADDDADGAQGEGGQPDGSAKALPGTGDPSSTAAVIGAAIAGLGALAAALRRRK